MPEPPHLAAFDIDDWAFHPLSMGRPRHPAEATQFGHVYPGCHPFGCDPQLMTVGEGRTWDRPVNWELRLSAQLHLHHNNRYRVYIRSDTALIRLLISGFILPSLVAGEQDPKKLQLLHLGQDLIQDPERALYPFPSEGHGLWFGGANFHPNPVSILDVGWTNAPKF